MEIQVSTYKYDKFGLPDESKDRQVPSGLSIPNFMNCTDVFGFSSRLTPPTRAASQWPWRMAWKAFSRASRLEEHAVSMEVLGPGGKGKGAQKCASKKDPRNLSTFLPTCWTILYMQEQKTFVGHLHTLLSDFYFDSYLQKADFILFFSFLDSTLDQNVVGTYQWSQKSRKVCWPAWRAGSPSYCSPAIPLDPCWRPQQLLIHSPQCRRLSYCHALRLDSTLNHNIDRFLKILLIFHQKTKLYAGTTRELACFPGHKAS